MSCYKNKIWDKVSNTIEKGFDIEPVYNEIYLNQKTKTKSYFKVKSKEVFMMMESQKKEVITCIYQ